MTWNHLMLMAIFEIYYTIVQVLKWLKCVWLAIFGLELKFPKYLAAV